MNEKLKQSRIEHPYNLSVGDQLWETALQNYADPVLQKNIREAHGFKGQRVTNLIINRDISKNPNTVHENIKFFLIREAARYLYENGEGRISAGDIVKLLTTNKFSIDIKTVSDCLQYKYPFLIDYYSIFIRTKVGIDKSYGEAILTLWDETKTKPKISEIAKRIGLTYAAVRDKLVGVNRSKNPAWLIRLYEQGPAVEPDNSY